MTATAAPARLTTPPEWADLLDAALNLPGEAGNTYNRFRHYSMGNQALLMFQGIFEPVNTYKGWAAMKRQVQKGCKAKSIYVPMFRKEEQDDGTKKERLIGFRLVPSVFGVSDTEGDDLPAWEPPTWSRDAALAALDVAEAPFREIDGNVQGYSFKVLTRNSVAINPVAAYPFKTLIHELAHIVAGHTADPTEYATHRGLMEFEAEATAYLVLNELGATDKFNASESRNYIQTWLHGQHPDEKSIKKVFSTADKILKAGYES